jgi:hypothetical protein
MEHLTGFRGASPVTACVTLVCVCAFFAADAAGQQSLKEAARVRGGKASRTMQTNMPLGSVSRVTEVADLIIRGKVVKTETQLTKNEDAVVTYAHLAPIQVLKGVAQATSRTPGPGPGIVFVVAGGTVKVDGLEMTYHADTAPDPLPQVGDEIIAFLVTNQEESGTFTLAYGGYGLLRVRGEAVGAANQRVARLRPLESNKVADVQRKVQELVAAGKR